MEITRRDFVVGCVVAAAGAAVGFPGKAIGAEARSKTVENLIKACNTGTMAVTQCTSFATKADEEGYRSVAALFRASAEAERIHLEKYKAVLKDLGATATEPQPTVMASGGTKLNLATMLKNIEANAITFSEYSKQATKDGVKAAAMFFGGTLADEASRARLYKQAASELDAWKPSGREFLVCQVCGLTTMDAGLKTCPVCSAPRSKFTSFN